MLNPVGALARHKKKLIALVALLLLVPAAHLVVCAATEIEPPELGEPSPATLQERRDDHGIRRIGRSYARMRGNVREVYLEGDPETLGAHHARLLRDRMIANETDLWSDFAHAIRFSPARALLMDIGRVRYRHVDRGVPDARLRELAAEASAFAPEPFEDTMPTFQRLLFLHALYDIALSFEHSPLIGCSSFALGPSRTESGHALMARAFDFEAADAFDRDKAVFFVRSPGTIPFASVSWPGMIGVMSGTNLEGVTIVVHGGRAREPRTSGLPVIYALREVLERARDTDEAIAVLRAQPIMVSHIVMVDDAKGHAVVVERAPGEQDVVRPVSDPDRVALTNHFEGSFKDDPRDTTVRRISTTLPRRARLDEMLGDVAPRSGNVEGMVRMLRDHTCAKNLEGTCELGDRRTIDALIATHGIVVDATDRVLWVSEGPHLSGRFVRFDLRTIFADDHDPERDPEPITLPEDPILHDGRYETGRAHAGRLHFQGDAR
ncbi:C45 family autoproteolytic acyltransferase/hydolase [Pendulispora albinea]|uniref:C45 family peptidase n=1 Tax=Pendulispora albinea TaxID=2741071 RepID=A0ABZ2LSR6_9BACT